MSNQRGALGKSRKGRLSLSKKTGSSKASSGATPQASQSIRTLFQRQQETRNRIHPIGSMPNNDSDIEIIEEKSTSPYFTKRVAGTERNPSRLSLKRNTAEKNVQLPNDDSTSKHIFSVGGRTGKADLDEQRESGGGSGEVSLNKVGENLNGPSLRNRLKRSKPLVSADGDARAGDMVLDIATKADRGCSSSDTSLEGNTTVAEELDADVAATQVPRSTSDSAAVGFAKQQLAPVGKQMASGDGVGADVLAPGADQDGQVEYAVPYYLENFQTILNSTLEDVYYSRLFNQEDRETITHFQALSEEGQKLYVRLFQRKLRWLRETQIQYPKIAENLTPAFKELVTARLLMDESHLDSLSDVLHALPAPDVRGLAKSLRISTSDQCALLIEAVLKHARQRSIGAFFVANSKGGTNEGNVLRRAKGLLGRCYRVESEGRWVFMRAMILCSLHTVTGDEDEHGNNTQLFQMLLSSIGQVNYPQYEIQRKAQLFEDRADLLSFCTAVQVGADIREAMEANALEEARSLYDKMKPEADALFADKDECRRVRRLPEHLRWYTAGAGYARALTQGVEALQKLRDYQQAVQQLKQLLAQRTYHTDYRGRWYERLALNLQAHLKQPAKAFKVLKEALSDSTVRVGHRLAIWQRAQKMCTTPSLKKLHHHWDSFKDDPMAAVKDAPTVTIEGRQLSVPGAMSTWCTEESADGSGHVTFIRHVEDVALRHYAQHGYPQGLHGEAGTLSTLLALLLWDVLFMDVPDAFINRHQTAPMDLYTDAFYTSRQGAIDVRLHWLEYASPEDIAEEFGHSWNTHENTLCVGLNWQQYEDVDHAKGLLRCVGGKLLSLVFSRMVKNLRFTRSGFPDLVVWNTITNKFKIVEVKGPNDRLSTKQILWLDYLTQIGVDAEVCYVVAVGTKKLR